MYRNTLVFEWTRLVSIITAIIYQPSTFNTNQLGKKK